MEDKKRPIIVTWDFTDKSEYSFQYAQILTKFLNTQIYLLHIVKKDSEVNDAQSKLDEVANSLESKYGCKPNTLIKVGNIFKTISDTAKNINTILIIMALHSSKRAHKVIHGSSTPYLLVQTPPLRDHISDIIMPVDTSKENRVQINWAILLSKYFECNINIIKPFINSDYKNDLMKKNIFFVRQHFDAKNVVYGIRTSKRKIKFNDAIKDFANEIEADMIFIMSYEFKNFMKGAAKTGLKTPVLCINPRTDLTILPDKR